MGFSIRKFRNWKSQKCWELNFQKYGKMKFWVFVTIFKKSLKSNFEKFPKIKVNSKDTHKINLTNKLNKNPTNSPRWKKQQIRWKELVVLYFDDIPNDQLLPSYRLPVSISQNIHQPVVYFIISSVAFLKTQKIPELFTLEISRKTHHILYDFLNGTNSQNKYQWY